jgi:transposase
MQVTVMQYNAPPHKHKDVEAWFANTYGLELMVWPPSSPDLNPIENL